MLGVERRSLVLTEDERKLTAYHEAGHAIVAMKTPGSDPVHKVTIVPRGRALGLTASLPETDRHSYTKDWLIGSLAMFFGGRVAEELVFGPEKVTTGAGNDIERATGLARRMVTQFGMSERVGRHGGRRPGAGDLPRPRVRPAPGGLRAHRADGGRRGQAAARRGLRQGHRHPEGEPRPARADCRRRCSSARPSTGKTSTCSPGTRRCPRGSRRRPRSLPPPARAEGAGPGAGAVARDPAGRTRRRVKVDSARPPLPGRRPGGAQGGRL